MLIVSKFHDYYDTGMKHGVDKTVVYERKTVLVKGDNFPPVSKYMTGEWGSSVLAFCGKFYPFVYHVSGDPDRKIDKVIWNLEDALAALNAEKKHWDDHSLRGENGIKKFFDRKYPDFEKYFHEYRTPIFGFDPQGKVYAWMKPEPYRSLVISPRLKEIQFYKVKDPVSAFQEIYMYISGVLGAPPKPKEKMSDKVLAAAKGHDGPYSFRKPPGKRGKKQWR